MIYDERGRELRQRLRDDPQFHAMFTYVYYSISNGETAIQDWRDAVNLAYTEWHAHNIGPIRWEVREGGGGSPSPRPPTLDAS